MAVAEQQSIEREPEPKQRSRQQAPNWPKPSQLRQSVPVLRLLTEIWSIPEVGKVGLLIDEAGVQVRVLIVAEDSKVRSKVYAAERAYLQKTPPHGFKLWVSPVSKVGTLVPPPFETIVER
jgi:hypothetical protein